MDRPGFPTRNSMERWLAKTAGAAALLAAMMGEAPAQDLRPATIAPASYNAAAVCPLCHRRGGCDCHPVAPTPPPVTGKSGDMGSADDGMGNAIDDATANQFNVPTPTQNYQNVGQVANSPVSLMPNMIGDNTGGGCGALVLDGAIAASIGHPTYACSRLNIAENNSAVVRDRMYVSYRHFHNATQLSVFPYSPQGRANDLDIDRFTFGFERRWTENDSFELRLPVNYQFGSKSAFYQGDTPMVGPENGSNNNLDDVLNDRDTEFGNLALIYKRSLIDRPGFFLSGGVGLNLPTAPDVNISGGIHDSNFPIYRFDGTLISHTNVDVDFDGTYRNQTVNLQPFLAMAASPNDDWFFQGFMQVDVPLNESNGSVSVTNIDVNGTMVADQYFAGKLGQQTLLRLNASIGRWLYKSDGYCPKRLGLMFEAHYTTTLNDADVATISPIGDAGVDANGDGMNDPVTLSLGNIANRIDNVNLVIGVPFVMGNTTIYNGFVAPVSHCSACRSFDFEYNLTAERRF